MTETFPSWMKADKDAVCLSIHVQPGAKREGIVGVYGEKLKIALVARPVEGKANKAIIEFFAKKLKVPKSKIEIVGGDLSREKRIQIQGVDPLVIAKLAG